MATRLTNSRDILQSIIHFWRRNTAYYERQRQQRSSYICEHISLIIILYIYLSNSLNFLLFCHIIIIIIFLYIQRPQQIHRYKQNYVNEFLCRVNSIEMKLFWNYLSSLCSFFARKSCNRVDDDDDDIKPPQLNQNN